jgi:hypothetical protein
MISGMRTDRPTAAIALPCAVALFLAGCSGGGFEGTVRCDGTTATLVYDPGERVEILAEDVEVGWADEGARGLNEDACEQVPTQEEWFVGIPYRHPTSPTTLRCRLPGQFFVHAHPSYSSKSGEVFPDGSALYLVAEASQTIVASAGIEKDSKRSSLSYSERYCTPK